MEPVDNVLAHYGVKGMRWGIRRKRSSGTPVELQSEMAQRKHEVLAKIKKHGIDAATNDDLKMLEQRVKLETKFNEQFPKKKHPAVVIGEEIVNKILIPVGEQQAKALLNKKIGDKIAGLGTPAKSGETPSTVAKVLDTAGSKPVKKKENLTFGYL